MNILSPGPGVGGHCISVDPWFLVHTAPQFTPLIRTAREVNDAKPHHVVEHVAKLARQFNAPKIGCLGLTYKADVDDLRESPSLEIVRDLRKLNLGEVLACDPYVSSNASPSSRCTRCRSRATKPGVVLLTDHRQFRDIPKKTLQGKKWSSISRPVALAACRSRFHRTHTKDR